MNETQVVTGGAVSIVVPETMPGAGVETERVGASWATAVK